ncbi:MAG: hypothetical protein ABL958_03450 [Bdellovibrionia bacterium]
MGLAEKRVTEEIKQKWNGGWLKQVEDAIGTSVQWEVKWETLVKDGTAGYAVDAFDKVFVQSLVEGFKSICQDQMGKDAVKGALKKIVIQNVDGITNGDYWCKFEGGVLTLDHQFGNVDYINDRKVGLVKLLEGAL